MGRRKCLHERFWSKVDVQGEDECWPWTAKCNRYGYGEFNLDGVRRSVQAYVVAYELTYGMILPLADLCVLHRCDNPPCCNPGHLWAAPISACIFLSSRIVPCSNFFRVLE